MITRRVMTHFGSNDRWTPIRSIRDVSGGPSRSPNDDRELERLRALVEEKAAQAHKSAVRARMAEHELERAKQRIHKQAVKEIEQSKRSILLGFLDVLDDLDRAFEAAEQDSSTLAGVRLVRRRFIAKLASFDVQREDALGQKFDPERHEAMTAVPVTNADEDGIVLGVLREGYAVGSDVLRPARVAVGKLIA